jgi:hypothetical protein
MQCRKSPTVRGDRKEKIFKTPLSSSVKATNKMATNSFAQELGTSSVVLHLPLLVRCGPVESIDGSRIGCILNVHTATAAAQKQKEEEEAKKKRKKKSKGGKGSDDDESSDDDDDDDDEGSSDSDSDDDSDADDNEEKNDTEEQTESRIGKAKKPADKFKGHKYMAPSEVLDHIKKLYAAEEKIMRLAFGSIRLSHSTPLLSPQSHDSLLQHTGRATHVGVWPADLPAHRAADPMVYFLEVVAVPPSRFRPLNMYAPRTTERKSSASKGIWRAHHTVWSFTCAHTGSTEWPWITRKTSTSLAS